MAPRDLPPLPALRAFEAVARRSSFKLAADELAVTPTAVSHQIRQLEMYLGLRVLNRTPRAVSLTPEGAALYEVTRSSLVSISEVVGRLRQGTTSARLTLSSTAAFHSHWMAPRFNALHRDLPRIDLRLHASDSVVDLAAGVIDAAIRYGKGPYDNAMVLCEDAFAPVVSPSLRIRTLADVRRTTLIHIDGRRRPQPLPDWRRWCEKAGLKGVDVHAGLHFPDSLLAVQAAIAGQGVAIVSLVLVADALAAGLLVAPFAEVLPGDRYHFVWAKNLEQRTDIVALGNWLAKQLSRPFEMADGDRQRSKVATRKRAALNQSAVGSATQKRST